MAKKPKNKKPAVVTTVEDVSIQGNETPNALTADKGKVPEPGVLPDGYEIDDEAFERFASDANAGALPMSDSDSDNSKPNATVLDQLLDLDYPDELGSATQKPVSDSPYGEVFFSTPSAKSEVAMTPDDETDHRGQAAGDGAKAIDAQIPIQTKQDAPTSSSELVGKVRELVPDAMSVSEDPVAKFEEAIVVEPQSEPAKKESIGSRIMDKSLLVTQDDHFLRQREIAGNFKTDNLQQLLPSSVGFLAGRLYMFAFSAERYKLPEVSAWVENNITWAQPDQVDFYYFNHSTDRAHVRNYREHAKLTGRIAVGLLAIPAHCLDMQPPHVIHSQEADGVFIYTGTQLIRNKLRCELEASLWPHTVTL